MILCFMNSGFYLNLNIKTFIYPNNLRNLTTSYTKLYGNRTKGGRIIMNLKMIDHISVSVQDIEKARDFYSRVLGLQEIPRPEFKFAGVWYKLGDVMIHVIHNEHSVEVDSKLAVQDAHLAFSVENTKELDDIIKKLEKEDIKWHELENAPSGLRQLFFKDPDGYMIEVVTPDPNNPFYESVYLKYYV